MTCPFCEYVDDDNDWDYRFCGCYPKCESNRCERDETLAECPECMELFDKRSRKKYRG